MVAEDPRSTIAAEVRRENYLAAKDVGAFALAFLDLERIE